MCLAFTNGLNGSIALVHTKTPIFQSAAVNVFPAWRIKGRKRSYEHSNRKNPRGVEGRG